MRFFYARGNKSGSCLNDDVLVADKHPHNLLRSLPVKEHRDCVVIVKALCKEHYAPGVGGSHSAGAFVFCCSNFSVSCFGS